MWEWEWEHDVQRSKVGRLSLFTLPGSWCDEHDIDLVGSPRSEEPKRDDDLLPAHEVIRLLRDLIGLFRGPRACDCTRKGVWNSLFQAVD